MVRRLREAGAIVVGLTSPELAIWFHRVRDLRRHPQSLNLQRSG
jgi:hypothetical protein